MEEKHTFEEFKEATVKEMLDFDFFPEEAKKVGLPLDQWCRAYLDYIEEHDEDNIVQKFYRSYIRKAHSFEYLAQNLADTLSMLEKPVPLEELSKHL